MDFEHLTLGTSNGNKTRSDSLSGTQTSRSSSSLFDLSRASQEMQGQSPGSMLLMFVVHPFCMRHPDPKRSLDAISHTMLFCFTLTFPAVCVQEERLHLLVESCERGCAQDQDSRRLSNTRSQLLLRRAVPTRMRMSFF